MSDNDGSNDGSRATGRTLRLVGLVVAGLIISNVVASLLFERDTALGTDELLTTVAGVGVALLIEFGVFRRRRR